MRFSDSLTLIQRPGRTWYFADKKHILAETVIIVPFWFLVETSRSRNGDFDFIGNGHHSIRQSDNTNVLFYI